MVTKTVNYALNKPTVDGDDEQWGTYLNSNCDILDAAVKHNEETAETAAANALTADSKATAAASTADLAMPKLGGDFTGAVSFSAPATFNNDASVVNTDGALKVQITNTNAEAYFAVGASGGHEFLDINQVSRALVDVADDTNLAADRSIVTRARGDSRYLLRADAVDNPVFAYGKINGLTGVVVKSSNLTCSRTAAGLYTIGFADEDPTDGSYTVQLTAMSDSSNTEARSVCTVVAGTQSTTSFNMQVVAGSSGTPFDPDNFFVTVLR